MIIAKIIRDLTMNFKNKEEDESGAENEDPNGSVGGSVNVQRPKPKKKKDREFTIDEEFFHSVIMPSIYSTVVAGLKQEHVSLFNLLFALEIALKKATVQPEDKDFFVQQFFALEAGKGTDWRQRQFVSLHERIKAPHYQNLKRSILKAYPETRSVFETIEIKIGKEFSYTECASLLKKTF